MNNLNKNLERTSILKGIGWTSLATIVNGITQILRLSILSRFLEKEDFGIVAILTFILGLTQVFSDMGFSASIMSQKNLDKKSFLDLYWYQFGIFNLVMIIVSLSSPLISDYYNAPTLKILVPLTMSELFFISLGRLYDTVLQKNMQFKTIALRNIITAFLSLIIAVSTAIAGFGVYSLIISTIFNALSVNLWNLIAGQSQYKLKFQRIDFKGTQKLMTIGHFQMGTQIVDYVASKLDIIIISIFLGVSDLGVYNLVKELVLKFILVINSIVNKVMLPVLASKQNNITALKGTFCAFIKRLSLLNAPIVGFMVVFSDLVIQLFYGNTYIDAYNIIKIMAIWSLFVVLGQPNGLLAIATKKTNITFNYSIFRVILMAVLLFSFARISLTATAWTMLVAYAAVFFLSWKMLLNKVISLTFTEYISLFFKSWSCIFVISFITISIRNMFKDDSSWRYNVYAIIAYTFMVLLYFICIEKQQIRSIVKIR